MVANFGTVVTCESDLNGFCREDGGDGFSKTCMWLTRSSRKDRMKMVAAGDTLKEGGGV